MRWRRLFCKHPWWFTLRADSFRDINNKSYGRWYLDVCRDCRVIREKWSCDRDNRPTYQQEWHVKFHTTWRPVRVTDWGSFIEG